VAWYKEWFGEEYLELYAHRNRPEAEGHVDFVERHFPPRLKSGEPRSVLDLACGGGRHTEALRRRGYRAVGVDLSLTLLATAVGLPRVGGDMRCLPFASGAFDTLLNFFTSFGYFESERENFRVLEEVVRILRPTGRFLIDFMNAEHVLDHLKPAETQETEGRRLDIERWYDPATRRINKRIRIRSGGEAPRCYLESVRAYSADEVTIGMRWAGLEVDALFGSFQGDPFSRDSERLIILGHKPG
jgi:SAM-dependent methyltransferase